MKTDKTLFTAENLYRLVFIAAGLYNLAFAIGLLISPDALFALADVRASVVPGYSIPLAIAIILFGVLYFRIAQHPYHSPLLVLIAFLGKAGPPLLLLFGLVFLDWSADLLKMVFFNDLIWLAPFFLLLGVNVLKRLSCYP